MRIRIGFRIMVDQDQDQECCFNCSWEFKRFTDDDDDVIKKNHEMIRVIRR